MQFCRAERDDFRAVDIVDLGPVQEGHLVVLAVSGKVVGVGEDA